MELFRSAISLLNRNYLSESFTCHNRFYCKAKGDSNQNSEIDQNNNISEQNNVKNAETEDSDYSNDELSPIDKNLAAGITISSYNICGFRLNQHVQVIGPIILFPRAVFSWNIKNADKIDADSLMIFGLIQPKIDTLIIGIGDHDTTANIGSTILKFAHYHKINVEILSTELACTQYNFLNSEGRMVGAALIPPTVVSHGDDDPFQSLNFDNKLFTIDNLHSPEMQQLNKKLKRFK